MDTPTSLFESLNISLVLWANHMLRASVYQMKKIAALIFANSSVLEADKKIASLEEIFRFQKVQELEEAEKIYLSHPSYKC
jgi:phosphoenolpyruvate phosphomutase